MEKMTCQEKNEHIREILYTAIKQYLNRDITEDLIKEIKQTIRQEIDYIHTIWKKDAPLYRVIVNNNGQNGLTVDICFPKFDIENIIIIENKIEVEITSIILKEEEFIYCAVDNNSGTRYYITEERLLKSSCKLK